MGTIIPNMGSELSIGNVLFGATRRAVLSQLFSHPDERHFQRQIISAANLGSGTVQRELEKLVQAGLVSRTVEGRQTYFQANRESPVFTELRGLVRKTFGLSELLADGLSQLAERIEVAFVFGSMATGTENERSDVDLFVVGDVSLMEVVNALADAQRELGRELNPSVYPTEEFCRKVAQGQHFIKQVIAGPKLFLIGDERRLKGLAEERLAQGASDKPRGGGRSSRRRR